MTAAVDLVERVRSFLRQEVTRELAANHAYQTALERNRARALPEWSTRDQSLFFEADRRAELAARERAADHFGLPAWKIRELEETLIPGDGRMRASRRLPEDPDYWDDIRLREKAGDYLVKPGDNEEMIALEDRANAAELGQRRLIRSIWERTQPAANARRHGHAELLSRVEQKHAAVEEECRTSRVKRKVDIVKDQLGISLPTYRNAVKELRAAGRIK